MAITTFAQLQTAIADWSNRSDLTSYLPDFITLAEGRLNDSLLLKDTESEESLTLTLNQNYVALPTGFVSPIALWLVISSQRTAPLIHRLPQDLPYDTSASIPREWAVDGVNIRFDCPAAAAYSAKFRMVKASNLSVSNTTNYLLTRRPDIYLAASLVELARFTRDAELFNEWEPKYLKASAELKAAESRSRSVNLRTDIGVGQRSNIFRGD
jgi:hypothetical protein